VVQRGEMVDHSLGVFERASTFQAFGDAGGAERVVADMDLNSRLACVALNHAEAVGLGHEVRGTVGATGGTFSSSFNCLTATLNIKETIPKECGMIRPPQSVPNPSRHQQEHP